MAVLMGLTKFDLDRKYFGVFSVPGLLRGLISTGRINLLNMINIFTARIKNWTNQV